MTAHRRFTDDQVREIFARAADRELAGVPAPGGEAGLTLTQLREIARAAGMDPGIVESVARDIAERDEAGASAPLQVRETRHLRAMPDGPAWERIVGELRDSFGVQGSASSFPQAMEWSSTAGRGAGEPPPVLVRAEQTERGARLVLTRVLEPYRRLPDMVGGGLGFFGLLYAGAGPLMGQPEAGLLTALALLSSGLLGSVGGRLLLRRWLRGQGERLAAVADRLALVAREQADDPAAPSAGVPAPGAAEQSA